MRPLKNKLTFVVSVIIISIGISLYSSKGVWIEFITTEHDKLIDKIEDTLVTSIRRRLLLDDDGRLPSALCIGNLLDQQNYDYSVLTSKSSNQSVVLKPDAQQPNPCRLLDYTTKHVVNCIDAYNSIKQTVIWTNKPLNDNPSIITNETSNETKEPTAVSMLRVAFVGDSRIRQQFFNFLKLIPDYDKESKPTPIPPAFHGDIDVVSKILQLKVSFRWRPLVDNLTMTTIAEYADLKESPHLLLISMEAHHMLYDNYDDIDLFEESLAELAPVLNRLAKVSQVIWLNQYPTVEMYGGIESHNTDIHTGKINHYNKIVRRIFMIYKNITIWDSSNPFAEEYVRSCLLLKRNGANMQYTDSYKKCGDYIHTGNSAIFHATQIFINNFCNHHIQNTYSN